MKLRRFAQCAALCASMASMAAAVAAENSDGGAEMRPPNIVLILTDDQGYADLGCYGAKDIATPRIDALAAEGMKLTSFYMAASVCTPARAALLTGSYPLRNHMERVVTEPSKQGLDSGEITIATMLKQRGYATACIGKWHLGHQDAFMPWNHGFDEYFGLPYSNDMDKPDQPDRPRLPLYDGKKIIEQPVALDTLTQRYTERAVKFIEAHQDKPFVLYMSHTMPHKPLAVSDAFRGKSQGGLYGDAIEEIDWSTGAILDTLTKLGIADETLVIFTSDNGPFLKVGGSAAPFRGGKHSIYEGGFRVPGIFRWPGHIPAGTTSGAIITALDILPTLAAATGAKLPEDRVLDGGNVLSHLLDPQQPVARNSLLYYDFDRPRAVRVGDWKLIYDWDGVKPEELYNLAEDPGEKINVIEANPEKVKELDAEKIRIHQNVISKRRLGGQS